VDQQIRSLCLILLIYLTVFRDGHSSQLAFSSLVLVCMCAEIVFSYILTFFCRLQMIWVVPEKFYFIHLHFIVSFFVKIEVFLL
jgi:hypothetical protein